MCVQQCVHWTQAAPPLPPLHTLTMQHVPVVDARAKESRGEGRGREGRGGEGEGE